MHSNPRQRLNQPLAVLYPAAKICTAIVVVDVCSASGSHWTVVVPGQGCTLRFTSEHAILEQLLYKNKNQHRKANYYQKLMAVARCNRHIHLSTSTLSSLHALLCTADALRSSLVAILRAAEPLYALLRQTYFMPFALTSLAVLARLLVVSKAALLVVLVEAKEREEREQDSVRLFTARSVGTALLRALRDKRVEDVAADMAGYELNETWTGAVEAVTCAESYTETTTAKAKDENGPPTVSPPQLRRAMMTSGVTTRDCDERDTALQPDTATTLSSTSRQSLSSASSAPSSASKRPPTLPTIALPHDTAHTVTPSKLPVARSHPATSESSVAGGSKKRKATAFTEQATAPARINRPPVRGRGQQPVGVQRTAGTRAVVKAATEKSSVPLDDIDAIFGF